jgi:hypothetical protein
VIDENNHDPLPTNHPLRFSNEPWDPDTDDIVLPTSNILWSLTIIAVVGAVLLVYFRKVKKHRPQNAGDNPH